MLSLYNFSNEEYSCTNMGRNLLHTTGGVASDRWSLLHHNINFIIPHTNRDSCVKDVTGYELNRWVSICGNRGILAASSCLQASECWGKDGRSVMPVIHRHPVPMAVKCYITSMSGGRIHGLLMRHSTNLPASVHAMKSYGEWRFRWTRPASCPGCPTCGERAPGSLWIIVLVGPRAGLYILENVRISARAGNRKDSFRCYLCNYYLYSTYNLPYLAPDLLLLDNDGNIWTRSGFQKLNLALRCSSYVSVSSGS